MNIKCEIENMYSDYCILKENILDVLKKIDDYKIPYHKQKIANLLSSVSFDFRLDDLLSFTVNILFKKNYYDEYELRHLKEYIDMSSEKELPFSDILVKDNIWDCWDLENNRKLQKNYKDIGRIAYWETPKKGNELIYSVKIDILKVLSEIELCMMKKENLLMKYFGDISSERHEYFCNKVRNKNIKNEITKYIKIINKQSISKIDLVNKKLNISKTKLLCDDIIEKICYFHDRLIENNIY